MLFVPLGYKDTSPLISNLDEVHGGEPTLPFLFRTAAHANQWTRKGSPWGAGTFAGNNGARQPSPLELELASLQGKLFWEKLARTKFAESE